jgi:hypothetical protein
VADIPDLGTPQRTLHLRGAEEERNKKQKKQKKITVVCSLKGHLLLYYCKLPASNSLSPPHASPF